MKAIGLMSGTSMDGIDASIIENDGKFEIKQLFSCSLKYSKVEHLTLKFLEQITKFCVGDLKLVTNLLTEKLSIYCDDYNIKGLVLELFAKNTLSDISFEDFISLSTLLHYRAIGKILSENYLNHQEIDIIGYHGQTLYHNIKKKISIQIGYGSRLARLTK